MKPLFLLLLPLWAASQPLLLLDRNLKAPFAHRNAVTLHELATGVFPLYADDLPAVVGQLQFFAQQLAANAPIASLPPLQRRRCLLFLQRDGKGFRCVLQTATAEFSVPLLVAQGNRKTTLRQINQFVWYLRQNSALHPPADKGAPVGAAR